MSQLEKFLIDIEGYGVLILMKNLQDLLHFTAFAGLEVVSIPSPVLWLLILSLYILSKTLKKE
jgi:hypothetical protein